MDNQNSLKKQELEEITIDEDLFLRELASFFAHEKMTSLGEVPSVISIYSHRESYRNKLERFRNYLVHELFNRFGKNGPRTVISKDVEPNTYSIPVDFFLENKKMPGLLPRIPRNGNFSYIKSKKTS